MAGRYTGSYPERLNGWRAAATLADIGQASLVERIPRGHLGFDDEIDNQQLHRTVSLSRVRRKLTDGSHRGAVTYH
jgi:hypothetical protein